MLATPPADLEPRCTGCKQKLGECLVRPWAMRCPKCKRWNSQDQDNPPANVIDWMERKLQEWKKT